MVRPAVCRFSAFLLILAVLATGCKTVDVSPNDSAARLGVLGARFNGTVLVRTELYFGMSRPGGTVSEGEWDAFLAEVVTPRFPDGLTVVDAVGQWRGSEGIQSERSKLLILIHAPERDSLIEEIRGEYRRRFAQESVLRVSSYVEVSF